MEEDGEVKIKTYLKKEKIHNYLIHMLQCYFVMLLVVVLLRIGDGIRRRRARGGEKGRRGGKEVKGEEGKKGGERGLGKRKEARRERGALPKVQSF